MTTRIEPKAELQEEMRIIGTMLNPFDIFYAENGVEALGLHQTEDESYFISALWDGGAVIIDSYVSRGSHAGWTT